MDPSSHPHAREALNAAQPACATGSVMLSFTPDHVGPMSIVAGLRSLAAGSSDRETWVIAQQALPDRPERIIAHCTVARVAIDDALSWRCCSSEGDPLGCESQALLPQHGPQDIESACAQLSAHLYRLAQHHEADVFRIDPAARLAIAAPPTRSYPERIWHRIPTRERKSSPVTAATVRERLCRAKHVSPETADRLMEAHAGGSGLLVIGEDWYSSVTRLLLPPMSREDYDRIVRALRAHIQACDSDRIRHAHAGNHGAARALASEEVAARRTLGVIGNLSQELP